MNADENITWTVWGAGWHYSLLSSRDEDPVEIATTVLESVCKRSRSEVGLGVLLKVTNSQQWGDGDEMMIPTSLVLANAGLYRESGEIDMIWAKMSEVEQLGHLVRVLGEEC
jgi:hypothetical protein